MTRRTQAPDRDNETYVPGHGDVSFAVDRYELDVDYSVDNNRLKGRATIHARALQPVNRIGLDLHALRVAKVTVDGQQVKYRHHHGKLVVTLKGEIDEGTSFTVLVQYSGAPKPMPGLDGDAGWEELADGVIVASQPHGAPSWYPCNDRPSDKAVHRIEVTVPADYTVVSNAALAGKRRRAGSNTWTFEDTAPMATYLATVQIGRYVRSSTKAGPVLHRTPVHTVHPPELAEECAEAFARQPDMIAEFSRLFGPYPFDEYTAVVTADELEIPLEAQGLSIFGSNFATTQWQHQRLIAHEMAHQWFGNSLTLMHWNDIWLHEGFACYAEWLWSEASGGQPAAQHANEHWDRLDGLEKDLVLADPGPDLMFDDRVYKRGALTLHALRRQLGDDVFFEVLRTWTSRFAQQSVTTEDFVSVCEEVSGRGLDTFFDAWLHDTALPTLG